MICIRPSNFSRPYYLLFLTSSFQEHGFQIPIKSGLERNTHLKSSYSLYHSLHWNNKNSNKDLLFRKDLKLFEYLDPKKVLEPINQQVHQKPFTFSKNHEKNELLTSTTSCLYVFLVSNQTLYTTQYFQNVQQNDSIKLCLSSFQLSKTNNKIIQQVVTTNQSYLSSCNNQEGEVLEKPNELKQKVNNELPSEQQLNEMMQYFQDQAPHLFTSFGWSYSKCSYKVIFENLIFGTRTQTLNAYIMQINIIKNITKLILNKPELSVIGMTKDIKNGSIHVRWQVQGVPRYWIPFSSIGIMNDSWFIRYIDGFSIFYLKSDGLYHKHCLLKMTPLKTASRRIPLTSMVPGLYGEYNTN